MSPPAPLLGSSDLGAEPWCDVHGALGMGTALGLPLPVGGC